MDELSPHDRERLQQHVIDRWLALKPWERTRRRNAARAADGLPIPESPLTRLRRRNHARRRAGIVVSELRGAAAHAERDCA